MVTQRLAVVRLAHAAAMRATLTSAAEWQRLAREAKALRELAEANGVIPEYYEKCRVIIE